MFKNNTSNHVESAKLLKYIANIFLIFFCATHLSAAWAAPTAAGVVIANQARVSYAVDGVAQTPTNSNIATFTVLEVVNVSLVWQDAAQVHVNTPQISAPLTFVLSNTGNGPQSFELQRNNAVLGDQFDPSNAAVGALFIENGLEPGFQATGPNADTVYVPGLGTPVLAAGASQTVYVVSDIPSGLGIGNVGTIQLQASSRTLGLAGSVPGTEHPNITAAGQSPTGIAVTGLTQGQASSSGAYVIDGAVVTIKKSIISPTDASMLIPGTQLRYRLLVEVQGIGTVQNVVVNDPVPAELSYVANSITVGGLAKSDANDSDNAQWIGNVVSVNLGNLTAPASYVIEFLTTLK